MAGFFLDASRTIVAARKTELVAIDLCLCPFVYPAVLTFISLWSRYFCFALFAVLSPKIFPAFAEAAR